MEFRYTTLATCEQEATGLVVVIDVLRAFTTAAYAFSAGAEEILLVSQVEEALKWKQRQPEVVIMGEVDGLPIPGFDLSNSPAEMRRQNLQGKRLVQRTSSGTQGVVRCRNAEVVFAASFVVAGATAGCILRLEPPAVTFVVTGARADQSGLGEEDRACADYLQALLIGDAPEPQPYLRRVRDSHTGRIFADLNQPEFPAADLDLAAQVDTFDFAMRVDRQGGLPVLKPVYCP